MYQYQREFAKWVQIGADINGEAFGDQAGLRLALDKDRLAVGARLNDANGQSSGHVRVFQYNSSTATWEQLGADIEGQEGEWLGESVALAGDIVAVGADLNREQGPNRGKVQVFRYTQGLWLQIDTDIVGDADNDALGWSLDLSADGLTIVVGVQGAKHARVFKFQGSSWQQLGAKISSDSAFKDRFGFSTSLSEDGRFFAVGAPDGGEGRGLVRVFQYDAMQNTWIQTGIDLKGEQVLDQFGWSISLSRYRLAVGARRNDSNGSNSGHVRIFEVDASCQLATVDGPTQAPDLGLSIRSPTLSPSTPTTSPTHPPNNPGRPSSAPNPTVKPTPYTTFAPSGTPHVPTISPSASSPTLSPSSTPNVVVFTPRPSPMEAASPTSVPIIRNETALAPTSSPSIPTTEPTHSTPTVLVSSAPSLSPDSSSEAPTVSTSYPTGLTLGPTGSPGTVSIPPSAVDPTNDDTTTSSTSRIRIAHLIFWWPILLV